MEEYDAQINFFDDYWIDFKKNLIRRWYSPYKVSEYCDPYSGAGCYHTAVWSPENNKYLMWHEYLPIPEDDEPRYLAVSESDDGMSWRPCPVSDTVDEEKKIYPNTVYTGNTGLHGTAVYRDIHDLDPSRRYKACGCTRSGLWHTAGKENSAVYLSTSPDGIHWTEQEKMMVHPNTSDTLNCAYYNPVSHEYNAILRAGFVDRRICITKSSDLQNWSKPQVCIHPESSFNDDAYAIQLYGISPHWVGGCFIGFLWKYYTSCTDFDYSRMNGFMDTELVYSYDGEHWMRTSGRPVIERPLSPEYGFSQLTISGFFKTKEGDKYRLLSNGTRVMHGEGVKKFKNNVSVSDKPKGKLAALITYEIRKDGFCGLEANATDGLIITKTFELYEARLAFNLRADFGFVRFAIMTHEGKPYAGFEFENCEVFSGNEVAYRPCWKDRSMDELKGKRIRIAIEMNGATIHAIYGCIRPWIRFPQISLGDPRHVSAVKEDLLNETIRS